MIRKDDYNIKKIEVVVSSPFIYPYPETFEPIHTYIYMVSIMFNNHI